VTEENSSYRRLQPRAKAEADIIINAFDRRERDPVKIGYAVDQADEQADDDVRPGGIAYMYAQGHILTRERYLGGVGGKQKIQDVLDASKQFGVLDILFEEHIRQVEVIRVVRDIVLIRWNPHPGEDDIKAADGKPPDVRDLLDVIDGVLGEGIATPDHVLTAAQELAPCSATEPQEVYRTAGPLPPLCRAGGARVRIFVADTGLVEGAKTTFPWLEGVTGDLDPRTGPGDTIQPYEGHGTFVTGVLRSMAPDAKIRVANLFGTAGSALESDFVRGLNREAFKFGFEIIHLTASCMTRKNIPLIALQTWLELLRPYKGVVCIAPAGNNHTRRPSWPGAFADVISVGALATDWRRRADFSDYGGWVDVYAPGEKLINAFGTGRYICQIGSDAGKVRTFSGLAQWSGTSFSAPIVTGLIAARMARCGESAQQAAKALLAGAQTIPGVGLVLLPFCGGDHDECRGGCGRCDDRGCGRCDDRGCGYCGCGRGECGRG
jgi:hypothetical protein